MIGYMTELAANLVLDGGTLAGTYYAQQHTDVPGLAFDENISPDPTRFVIVFGAAAGGARTNTNASSLPAAPADTAISYLTLWTAAADGECHWVALIDEAPVTVTAGNIVGINIGDLTLALDIWTQ